jgi:hypothetical protein
MMFTAEDHPHNAPDTWRVEGKGSCWRLVTKDGIVLGGYPRKRDAEAAKHHGFEVSLYFKEGLWYSGKHIPGWKDYDPD